MVERDARDRLALLLRRLATGRITNDEFEDALPWGSEDAAIWAVFREGAWCLYDDLDEHRLVGKHRLSRENRREVAKWILFLKSDKEYEWPRHRAWKSLLYWPANVITLGLMARMCRRRWRTDPDRQAWPFRTAEDLQRVVGS